MTRGSPFKLRQLALTAAPRGRRLESAGERGSGSEKGPPCCGGPFLWLDGKTPGFPGEGGERMYSGYELLGIFFDLCAAGLVYRGELCGPGDGEIRQPGIPQRAGVSHLRLRRGHYFPLPGAAQAEPAAALSGVGAADLPVGAGGRICAGEALPSALVGLLRRALQSGRLYLPAFFHRLGADRAVRGGSAPSDGDAAGAPAAPIRWAWSCWPASERS